MKAILTVEDVQGVFERLVARAVAAGVGDECLLVIHQVKEEVIGELGGGEEEEEDGPRERVLGSLSAAEFDRAAWELLGGWFADVAAVEAARLALVLGWSPGLRTNAAMLAALREYGRARARAGGWGEAPSAAHQYARREGRLAYNREIGR